MKKIDLIHTTILIIGLLAGYSAVSYFIAMLSFLTYSFDEVYRMEGRALNGIVFDLVGTIILIIACLIIIRNGRRYAAMVLKDEPEATWEDAPKLNLDRGSLIFVLLVGMGVYTLIQTIPYLLQDAWLVFTNKIDSERIQLLRHDKGNMAIDLLKVTIGVFLIYAAPKLTNIIEKSSAPKPDSEP